MLKKKLNDIEQFKCLIRPFFLFPCFTNVVLPKLGEEAGKKNKNKIEFFILNVNKYIL